MTTCTRCGGSVGRFGYDQEMVCLLCGWDQVEPLTPAEAKAIQLQALRQLALVRRMDGRGCE